jgi:hypothetical protein
VDRQGVQAKFGKLAGDEIGRAVLLEAKLGMCVHVLPPGGHFALKQSDEVWDLHGEQLSTGYSNSRRNFSRGRQWAT